MADIVEDLFDFLRPDKRLGFLVVDLDKLLDCADEVGNAVKDAATDSFARNLAEPAFNEIEPRGTGWREVQMKARVFFQPGLNILFGATIWLTKISPVTFIYGATRSQPLKMCNGYMRSASTSTCLDNTGQRLYIPDADPVCHFK